MLIPKYLQGLNKAHDVINAKVKEALSRSSSSNEPWTNNDRAYLQFFVVNGTPKTWQRPRGLCHAVITLMRNTEGLRRSDFFTHKAAKSFCYLKGSRLWRRYTDVSQLSWDVSAECSFPMKSPGPWLEKVFLPYKFVNVRFFTYFSEHVCGPTYCFRGFSKLKHFSDALDNFTARFGLKKWTLYFFSPRLYNSKVYTAN